MQRRLAQLPLHTGNPPGWLFRRVVKLATPITIAIFDEYGPEEMLRRLAAKARRTIHGADIGPTIPMPTIDSER